MLSRTQIYRAASDYGRAGTVIRRFARWIGLRVALGAVIGALALQIEALRAAGGSRVAGARDAVAVDFQPPSSMHPTDASEFFIAIGRLGLRGGPQQPRQPIVVWAVWTAVVPAQDAAVALEFANRANVQGRVPELL